LGLKSGQHAAATHEFLPNYRKRIKLDITSLFLWHVLAAPVPKLSTSAAIGVTVAIAALGAASLLLSKVPVSAVIENSNFMQTVGNGGRHMSGTWDDI
jgi:hypothetical protein